MVFHYYILCDDYYSKEWFKGAYARPINSVSDPQDWYVPIEVKSMIVLPFEQKRQAGRLREVRIPLVKESRRKKKM